MKKVFALLLAMVIATPAVAGPRHHDNYRSHNHRGDKWVAPLIGGVVLGAIIADAKAKERENNQRVIVVKEPQQFCEPVTVIVKNRWGDIIERYSEYRCTQY